MIPSQSESHLFFQHIMWQPTFLCSRGCKYCYVFQNPKRNHQSCNVEIVDLIFNQKKVGCNQFTVSLDRINNPPDKLILVLKTVVDHQDSSGINNLCITVHTMEDFQWWAYALGMSPLEFFNAISHLSISRLPKREEYQRLLLNLRDSTSQLTKLTYNATSINLEDQELLRRLHIYHILIKPPAGQSIEKQEPTTKWFKDKQLADELGLLHSSDQCVLDSYRRLTKGWSCGAGITKVHIWPDGSATGCPYDSKYCGTKFTGTDTWKSLLSVREQARQSHPMLACPVLSMLSD